MPQLNQLMEAPMFQDASLTDARDWGFASLDDFARFKDRFSEGYG